MTLAALARVVADRLAAAGIPSAEARLDAELLIRATLSWDRVRWIIEAPTPAPSDVAARLEPLVARRVAREPMAYILGRCEFWGREFEVGPGVLIPRPETELIVEEARRALGAPTGEPETIIDVGTGSGCLAITLALERPRASVHAVDPSPGALSCARHNAIRHGVAPRITFEQATLLGTTPEGAHLVVSNPPYVPEPDREGLQPEVVTYEPGLALFAGDDGLDVIRPLIEASARGVRPGGWLIFEFGYGQAEAVRALIGDGKTWTDQVLVPDLAGIPRVAVARRGRD